MARVLIVGGGCRGRQLARSVLAEGHAVRISTRGEGGRAAIESAGAECWIGTPARPGTLRGALEGVTIACWLLGSATGSEADLRELHTARLERFLAQTVDTSLRGFVYEARGTSTPRPLLAEGERIARSLAERNAIPIAVLRADPAALDAWTRTARTAIDSLLARRCGAHAARYPERNLLKPDQN